MSKISPLTEAIGHRGAAVAGGAPRTAVTSLGAASVAAGDDDTIPRIFLGVADLVVLALAFLAAHSVAPAVQRSFLPGGVLDGFLPAIFPVPATPTPAFPPLSEVMWLLVATAPATLVVMELIGGYQRLLGQSVARLVTSPVLSQTIAISFSALIVFALTLIEFKSRPDFHLRPGLRVRAPRLPHDHVDVSAAPAGQGRVCQERPAGGTGTRHGTGDPALQETCRGEPVPARGAG